MWADITVLTSTLGGDPHAQGRGSEGEAPPASVPVTHGLRETPAVFVQSRCMLLAEGLGTVHSIVVRTEGPRGLALCPGVAARPQRRACGVKTGLCCRKPPSQGSLS